MRKAILAQVLIALLAGAAAPQTRFTSDEYKFSVVTMNEPLKVFGNITQGNDADGLPCKTVHFSAPASNKDSYRVEVTVYDQNINVNADLKAIEKGMVGDGGKLIAEKTVSVEEQHKGLEFLFTNTKEGLKIAVLVSFKNNRLYLVAFTGAASRPWTLESGDSAAFLNSFRMN
jgi:hypothetical protein